MRYNSSKRKNYMNKNGQLWRKPMQNFKTRKKNEKKPIKYENVFKKNAILYHCSAFWIRIFQVCGSCFSDTDETTNSYKIVSIRLLGRSMENCLNKMSDWLSRTCTTTSDTFCNILLKEMLRLFFWSIKEVDFQICKATGRYTFIHN